MHLLHFLDATALQPNDVPDGFGKIWLNKVTCTGSENNLFQCRTIGTFYCRHAQDVGVRCGTAPGIYVVVN